MIKSKIWPNWIDSEQRGPNLLNVYIFLVSNHLLFSFFPSFSGRFGRVIVTTKDGDRNLIRREVFKELRILDEIIQNATVTYDDQTFTYKDVCARDEYGCFLNNILDLDLVMDQVSFDTISFNRLFNLNIRFLYRISMLYVHCRLKRATPLWRFHFSSIQKRLIHSYFQFSSVAPKLAQIMKWSVHHRCKWFILLPSIQNVNWNCMYLFVFCYYVRQGDSFEHIKRFFSLSMLWMVRIYKITNAFVSFWCTLTEAIDGKMNFCGSSV